MATEKFRLFFGVFFAPQFVWRLAMPINSKFEIPAGATSKLVRVFVQNSLVTTNAGLTGLTSGSSGLTCYSIRECDSSTAVVSLSGGTVGTWSSGGFKEVDATNMPGLYEVGIPNAAIASGSKSVVLFLRGATNMSDTPVEFELTAVNNQDSASFGVTAIKVNSPFKKNTALNGFTFEMRDSASNLRTGLTVSAQVSIDGAAFVTTTNNPAEVSNGVYKINLAAADTNGNFICLRFFATGAVDTLRYLGEMP